MILTGRFVLIGFESKVSQKTNKPYLRIALAQGADTVSLMYSNMDAVKFPLYKEYVVTMSYNSKYERLSIENMKTVE